MTKEIIDDEQKKKISRSILESLKEWFEVDSSREAYINDSPGKLFFASFEGEKPTGFLYLKETGASTVELAVMGVYPDYDRTNKFYLALGFKEFEVIPTYWDQANPCQIYVMNI